eukprot:2720333-Rhodomonas_salina.1
MRDACVLRVSYYVCIAEISFREYLAANPAFRLLGDHEKIRMICPSCSENRWVFITGWSCSGGHSKPPRLVKDMSGVMCIIGVTYQCNNISCEDNRQALFKKGFTPGTAVQNDGVNRASGSLKGCGVTWSSWTDRGVSVLPKTVIDQLPWLLIPRAEGSWTKNLAFSALSPKWTTSEFQRSVQDQYALKELEAQNTYLNLCDQAQTIRRERFPLLAPMTFLPWLHTRHPTSEMSSPSIDSIQSCLKLVWKTVEPVLKRRMMNTTPGVGAKIDCTFRCAGKVNAGEHGKPKCIWFMLGEDNSVVGWWALNSESWGEMHEAHLGVKRRLARLGTLYELKAFWYDRCCQGRSADHISRHPLVFIFPNVDRCPYGDGFHAINRVQATCLPFHPRHAAFASDMGVTIRMRSERHLERVVQYCMRQHQVGRSVAEVMAVSDAYSKCIPRVGRPPQELARAWQELMVSYKAKDERDIALKQHRLWRDDRGNSDAN